MKSSPERSFVSSYIRSRISRTISTALISVFSMSGHLAWGVDGQRPVPLLQIHGVKEPDLIEANDVPEIPAYQQVRLGDARQSEMQHVGSVLRPEHTGCLVGREEIKGFLARLDVVTSQLKQIRVNLADGFRR